VFPHFCPDKREIWHGPLPRAKFHVDRGNVSPQAAGRKTHFWTTE